MQLLKFFLVIMMAALPCAASAEYKTIDDIARAYSDETCKECHAKVYEE